MTHALNLAKVYCEIWNRAPESTIIDVFRKIFLNIEIENLTY